MRCMIMKIQKSKTTVKACDENVVVVDTVSTCPECDNRAAAAEFIQSAISALSACALETPDDTVLTDSIANLGVVLLDLQSTK